MLSDGVEDIEDNISSVLTSSILGVSECPQTVSRLISVVANFQLVRQLELSRLGGAIVDRKYHLEC